MEAFMRPSMKRQTTECEEQKAKAAEIGGPGRELNALQNGECIKDHVAYNPLQHRHRDSASISTETQLENLRTVLHTHLLYLCNSRE